MSIEKTINNRSRRMDIIREVIRWGTHVGAVIPMVILIFDYLTSNLTANPIQTAEQRTGRIALILLILTLAVTPILTIYKTRLLTGTRKRLGLYSFFYASVHLFIFIFLDYGLNWVSIFKLMTQKVYIIFGLIAFLILLAMAITSFQWWKRKLAKNWKRLHRLVYLAVILIILHYALAQKGDLMLLRGNLIKPLVYGLITVILLLLRLPFIKKAILWLETKIQREN
jgi:sulfoxide reductase heme-binding subunit YedZ